jgi:hypothetical protein
MNKAKFDRAIATELEVRMQNIRVVKMEEIWAKHWKKFTAWGMEAEYGKKK